MTDPNISRPEAAEPLIFGGRLLRTGDRIGPFVFEREIGSGGMARVLLARDPGGAPVALKVLRANRFDTGLVRFRREFHALSRISHTNIIRVDAYGDLFGHPYIAMEFVDGPDLHTVVRSLRYASDEQRFLRCEDILIQLCRALAAIHRRGLVHRDLKPSNVLITREGVCKLTDFGIVKDLDPKASPHVSATLVGTWAYTSPEHIGGLPVDHRSDLYSLGVILFALLTGKRPFVADSMAGYLEAHRDKRPPRASRVRANVPEHLDEICARLLEKAPRDRFQSAQEILFRLEADDHTESDNGRSWDPPLVGNRVVVEAIEEAVHALTAGRGALVRLIGDEGAGKSRLLEHAESKAQLLGLPMHRHAFRADAPLFAVAMKLARQLVQELPPHEGTDLRQLVQVWSEGSSLRGDTRYALYDGLRAGLRAALADRPRLLLFDDLHEAHPQELDLVRYLTRSLVGAESQPLLVVETTRRALPGGESGGVPTRELRLEPLRLADLRMMVASLLGPGRSSELLAERLHAETDGNPYFATEFLRSLLAQNLITRQGAGWMLTVEPAELAGGHLEIPPGIRQVLRRRLDDLSPGERQVVDVLATSGHEVRFDVLLDVLGTDDEEAELQRIDRLIEVGLVVEHRRGDDVAHALVHRTMAELVARELPEVRRTSLHRALAGALERHSLHDPEALEVIGEHWRQAGEASRAYLHLVTAAGRLVERSLPEAAWTLSEKAAAVEAAARVELPANTFTDLRMEHLLARGAALHNKARLDEAAAVYAELTEVALAAGDERAACKARLELARVLRQRGMRERARSEAESALRVARRLHYRPGVASALHNLAALAWVEGDMERCDRLAEEGLLAAQGPQLASERARLLLTVALVMAMRGHLSAAARSMAEAEGIFTELRMAPQRVLCLANMAELQVWMGEADEAWMRADEACRVAEDLGYKLGEILAWRTRAMAALERGRIGDAQDDLHRTIAQARAIEAYEEVTAAAASLCRASLLRGDPLGALRHAAVGLEAATHRDPERYVPLLQALMARCLGRRHLEAAVTLLRSASEARASLPVPRQVQVDVAVGQAWLVLGDPEEAAMQAEVALGRKGSRAFRLAHTDARRLLAAARGTTSDGRPDGSVDHDGFHPRDLLDPTPSPTEETVLEVGRPPRPQG